MALYHTSENDYKFTPIPSQLLSNHGEPILRSKCTFTCAILDECFGGGLPCGIITEITGESGVGKTQLCMQIILAAQLPVELGGLKGSSLYLYSDRYFPSKRLHEMAQEFKYVKGSPRQLLKSDTHDPLDFIYAKSVTSSKDLMEVVLGMDAVVKLQSNSQFPIKVIVVDSIASIFKCDYNSTGSDMAKRSHMFFKLSAVLREVATKHNIAVLTINQVADVVFKNNYIRVGNEKEMHSSEHQVCPSLGLSWSNYINSRFFMAKKCDVNGFIEHRLMKVVFSPYIGDSYCYVVLCKTGVIGYLI